MPDWTLDPQSPYITGDLVHIVVTGLPEGYADVFLEDSLEHRVNILPLQSPEGGVLDVNVYLTTEGYGIDDWAYGAGWRLAVLIGDSGPFYYSPSFYLYETEIPSDHYRIIEADPYDLGRKAVVDFGSAYLQVSSHSTFSMNAPRVNLDVHSPRHGT